MRLKYVPSHEFPPWPDAHIQRALALSRAVPGLVYRDRPDKEQWDAAVFDTYESSVLPWVPREADRLVASGARIVSLARSLNGEPVQERTDWSAVVRIGPYEDVPGEDVGPIVEVHEQAELPSYPILLIVSRWRSARDFWPRAARILNEGGRSVTLTHTPMPGPYIQGFGPEEIAKAEVVVGGAGGGNLYETLWAGKRLVAKAFSVEQKKRLVAAIAAGEAVVEIETEAEIPAAVERVMGMEPLGLRASGIGPFAELLGGM